MKNGWKVGQYTIIRNGHTMFPEDVCKLLKRLDFLEEEKVNKQANEKDNGGSAYPDNACQTGMSLRDYFAGQALVGLIFSHPETAPSEMRFDSWVAGMAYGFADAMIKERNK